MSPETCITEGCAKGVNGDRKRCERCRKYHARKGHYPERIGPRQYRDTFKTLAEAARFLADADGMDAKALERAKQRLRMAARRWVLGSKALKVARFGSAQCPPKD